MVKDLLYLRQLCCQFRMDVLKAIHDNGSGHCGGSLSVCEILTAIYFLSADVKPENPKDEDQDRIVLSKGHAAPMLYRILAQKGYIPTEEFGTFRRMDSRLQGHPCMRTPGVDMPSGPLGIGLGAAVGIALGMKTRGIPRHVYVVMGDGELNEGVVWEAAMAAAKYNLNNLIITVDRNHYQLDGAGSEIMPLEPLAEKWGAFGMKMLQCDGHNLKELSDAYARAKEEKDRPVVILADTVKGKGVSFMENTSLWHGKQVADSDLKAAEAEIRKEMERLGKVN